MHCKTFIYHLKEQEKWGTTELKFTAHSKWSEYLCYCSIYSFSEFLVSFYFVILSYLFWQKLLIAFVLNDPKVDKRSWLGEAAWRSALKGSLCSHRQITQPPSNAELSHVVYSLWEVSMKQNDIRKKQPGIDQRQHYTTFVSAPVWNNKLIINSGIVRAFLYCFNICARGIKLITTTHQSTSWSLFY